MNMGGNPITDIVSPRLQLTEITSGEMFTRLVKAFGDISADKDNKKEPIKQEEIKENSSQELIQESSNVQDSISKEQEEIDNVNDSIKEHTEEMDKAVDSESQKIIISEKLAKQLDKESDALDEVENKKDNDSMMAMNEETQRLSS